MARGHSQSAFDGPFLFRSTQPCPQSFLGNAGDPSKIGKSVECASIFETDISTPVVRLLLLRGPADIPRLIIAIIVGPSVQCVFNPRALTHICQKTFEGCRHKSAAQPPVTDLDAEFLIMSKASAGRIRAPLDHVLPARVCRRTACARGMPMRTEPTSSIAPYAARFSHGRLVYSPALESKVRRR